MVNYTPIDPTTYSNIPLTGVLIPGTTVGYIAESQFIKGGYIVVKTVEDRDALLDTTLYEDRDILSIGTPVYVSDLNQTYRYVGDPEVWQEDTADMQNLAANISSLQQNVEELSQQLQDKASNEQIQTIETNVTDLQNQIAEQGTELANKLDADVFNSQINGINSAIALKADAASTEAAISNLQDTKANASDVYTSDQVDQLLGANLIWNSAEPTKFTVGGLNQGVNLNNKSLKEVLMLILYGQEFIEPTTKEPTLTLTAVNPIVGIANSSIVITGSASFDRGQILLNGEVQNCLAGKAVSYEIGNGGSQIVSLPDDEQVEVIPINYTLNSIPLGTTELVLTLNYAQGPQPIDSFGNNVGSPYPAGSISSSFEVIGLTNTWTGNSNDVGSSDLDNIVIDGIITDSSEAAKDRVGVFEDLDEQGNVTGAGYQFTANASQSSSDYSEIYAPVVLIPQDVTITGIQAWDDLQNQWNWYRGENAEESLAANSWVAGETVEREINHQTIKYTVFTHNGVLGAPLAFRFFVA